MKKFGKQKTYLKVDWGIKNHQKLTNNRKKKISSDYSL